MAIECPDVDGCRDKIFERIREAEDNANKKVTTCAEKRSENWRSRVRTAIIIATFVLGFGGTMLTIYTKSIAQDEAKAETKMIREEVDKTKERVQKIELKMTEEISTIKSDMKNVKEDVGEIKGTNKAILEAIRDLKKND